MNNDEASHLGESSTKPKFCLTNAGPLTVVQFKETCNRSGSTKA
jgi:hypothetical protein